jgi:hypothetical protein
MMDKADMWWMTPRQLAEIYRDLQRLVEEEGCGRFDSDISSCFNVIICK